MLSPKLSMRCSKLSVNSFTLASPSSSVKVPASTKASISAICSANFAASVVPIVTIFVITSKSPASASTPSISIEISLVSLGK